MYLYSSKGEKLQFVLAPAINKGNIMIVMVLLIYHFATFITFAEMDNNRLQDGGGSRLLDCSNIRTLLQFQNCYCSVMYNDEDDDDDGNGKSRIFENQINGLERFAWSEYMRSLSNDDGVRHDTKRTVILGFVKELCALYPFIERFGKNILIITEAHFKGSLESALNLCAKINKNKLTVSVLSSSDPVDSIQRQLIQHKIANSQSHVLLADLTLTTEVLKIVKRLGMSTRMKTWIVCFSDLLLHDILPENAFTLEKKFAVIHSSRYGIHRNVLLNARNTKDVCGENAANISTHRYTLKNKTETKDYSSSHIADVKWYQGKKWVHVARILKNETQYESKFPSLLSSRSMRIVTIIDPPFTMVHKSSSVLDSIDQSCKIGKLCWKYETVASNNKTTTRTRLPYCCIGFCMDLLTHIENELQFTSDIYIVEDSTYGATVNGTWVGMVGDLVQSKADMIVAALTISGKRSQVISFTDSYMIGGVAIATLLEKSSLPFFNTKAFSPLSGMLWLAMFIVTIVSSYLLVLAERLGTRAQCNVQQAYSMRHSLAYIAGLLFQRDIGGRPPISFSSRFFSILIALATVVVMTSYTAVLTANKVTYTNTLPITGFKDKKITDPTPSFKYATIADSAFTDLFQSSTDPDWNRMYHFMKSYNFRDTGKAIEQLKTGELNAIIHDYPVLYHFISKEKDCGIQFAGESIKDAGYGLAVAINNTLEKTLSHLIRDFEDNGIIRSLTEKWMSSKCSGALSAGNSQQDQQWDGINDFGGLFAMMLCGCGLTLVCFLFEITKYCLLQQWRARRNMH